MFRMLRKLLYVSLFVGLLNGCLQVEGLGVNWGTVATHQLPSETVVQMLQDNGINKVKLFEFNDEIFSALAGTGIEVMVAIANDQLKVLNNYGLAKEFVRQNVTRYNPQSIKGVNITYIAVGNEPFLKDYNNSLVNVTFPALRNVQNALNEAGIGNTTKATIPLNADVYFSPDDNPVPSAGKFRPDIAEEVSKIVEFLHKNGAPFVVNVYPFLSLYYGHGHFPFDYAFFDGVSNPLVDNGASYTNMFDANYDTLVSALTDAGYGNLTIMVGEIGWPTDGDNNANAKLASKFYNGLLPRLAANKGTPLRPGYIEVYLFSLFDENAKSILPGNFERHWGLFGYDGRPKFPFDLSGKNKSTAVPAQNVTYLPKKWCVLKPDVTNASEIEAKVEYACLYSDCTALSNGSSCSDLKPSLNASYAFNAYFQAQNQVEGSCDFQGLAMVTTKNLSEGTCNLAIQIAPPPSPPPAPSPEPIPSLLDAPSPSKASGSGSDSDSTPGTGSGSPSTGSTPSTLLVVLALLIGLVNLLPIFP